MSSNDSIRSKVQKNVFSNLRVIPFPSKQKKNTVEVITQQNISSKKVIKNVVSLKIDNINLINSINSLYSLKPEYQKSINGFPRSPRSKQLNYSPFHSSSPRSHSHHTKQQVKAMSRLLNSPPKDGTLTQQNGSNSKNVIPNSAHIICASSHDNVENLTSKGNEINKSNVNKQIVSSVQRIDLLTSAFNKIFSPPQPSSVPSQIHKPQQSAKSISPSRHHINEEQQQIIHNTTYQKSKPTSCKHQQIICYHFSELPFTENKNTTYDKPVSPASGSSNQSSSHFLQQSTKPIAHFSYAKDSSSKISRSLERPATARAAFQVPYATKMNNNSFEDISTNTKPRIHNNASFNANSGSCSPFSNSILRHKISSNRNRIQSKQSQQEEQYLEGQYSFQSRKQSQNMLPTTSQVSVRTIQLLNQNFISRKTAQDTGFFDGLNSMGISRTNLHKTCEQNQQNVDNRNNTSTLTSKNESSNSQINFQLTQQPQTTKESNPVMNSNSKPKENEEIINHSKLGRVSKELGESTNQAIISYFIGTQSSSPFRKMTKKTTNNHKSSYLTYTKDHQLQSPGSSNSLVEPSSQQLIEFEEDEENEDEEEYQSTPISSRHLASCSHQHDHMLESSKGTRVNNPSSTQLPDYLQQKLSKSKRNSIKSRSKSKRKLLTQTSKLKSTPKVSQAENKQQAIADVVENSENGNLVQETNLKINLIENSITSKPKIIQRSSNSPKAKCTKQVFSKTQFAIPKIKQGQQNQLEHVEKEQTNIISRGSSITQKTEDNKKDKEEENNMQQIVDQQPTSLIIHTVQAVSTKFKRTYKSYSPKSRPATASAVSSKAK